MLSGFFLRRPVFAWVIAIVIMAIGALAIYNLPVSHYSPIAPPYIYTGLLSRSLCRDSREQRYPDHRAEDDRGGQYDLSVCHQ